MFQLPWGQINRNCEKQPPPPKPPTELSRGKKRTIPYPNGLINRISHGFLIQTSDFQHGHLNDSIRLKNTQSVGYERNRVILTGGKGKTGLQLSCFENEEQVFCSYLVVARGGGGEGRTGLLLSYLALNHVIQKCGHFEDGSGFWCIVL